MNNSIYDIVAKNVKQIFDEENISVIVIKNSLAFQTQIFHQCFM